VHTLYFWPDPARQLAELHRVLRPGGRLVLAFRERTDQAVARFPAPTYTFYSTDEVAALLTAAGFRDREMRPASSGADLHIAVASR
jgi:SAM-dependent methyltransferase